MANKVVSDLKKQVYELERQLKLRDSRIENLAKENTKLKSDNRIIEL